MPYISGDYKVICDRCGFERYASDCILDWQGFFVCRDTCYEAKHPQFTPPKPLGEKQSVPIKRKETEQTFIDTTDHVLSPTTTKATPNDGYFITSQITVDDL